MESPLKLLLIDDDEKLLHLMAEYLPRYQMEVLTTSKPEQGLEIVRSTPPDLVVMDVSMPGMDGFDLCREIRKFSGLPIIMLSARGEATDKIVGLELGADDYMSKPFEPRELVTRIQTIMRRARIPSMDGQRIFGELRVNISKREVWLGEENLGLTTMEFDLISLLTESPGKKFSRDEIMKRVQGFDSVSFSRSIDILISRLRTKLKDSAKDPRYIKSVHGYGYVFTGEGL